MLNMDKQEILQILEQHNIDYTVWGKAKASKPLEDFLEEVLSSESTILKVENGQAWIDASGASVTLWTPSVVENRTWHFLREDRQEWHNGRSRKRDLICSIGEKALHNEDPHKTLQRCFEEEMNMKVTLNIGKPQTVSFFQDSESFPGIKRNYHINHWDALMPEHMLQEEYVEKQSKKNNYWRWQHLPLGLQPPKFNLNIQQAEFIS